MSNTKFYLILAAVIIAGNVLYAFVPALVGLIAVIGFIYLILSSASNDR